MYKNFLESAFPLPTSESANSTKWAIGICLLNVVRITPNDGHRSPEAHNLVMENI